MRKEALDQYLLRKSEADDEQDLIGRLLFELLTIENDGRARIESLRQLVAENGKRSERSNELDQEMLRRLLREIRVAVEKKTFEKYDDAKLLSAVSALEKAVRENRPKEVIFDELIAIQKTGFDGLGKVLGGLLEEVRKQRTEKPAPVPAPKIEIPKEFELKKPKWWKDFPQTVEVNKPVWWKDFSFSWAPLEKMLAPLKMLLEKIASREDQELPIKNGRVQVEVDRVGGGLGNPFQFDTAGNLKVTGGTGGGGGDASEATLQSILAALDTVETKLQSIIDNTDTLEGNTDGLEGLLTQIRDYVDALETNTTGLATETTLVAVRDYLDTVETKLQSLIDKSAGSAILKKTVALTGSGTVHDPAAGKKIRLYSIKFSLSADMTDVSFDFGSGSAFEKYLNPKTGGLYGWNTHPDYVEGAIDENLDCVITGTGTVQINIEYVEI